MACYSSALTFSHRISAANIKVSNAKKNSSSAIFFPGKRSEFRHRVAARSMVVLASHFTVPKSVLGAITLTRICLGSGCKRIRNKFYSVKFKRFFSGLKFVKMKKIKNYFFGKKMYSFFQIFQFCN